MLLLLLLLAIGQLNSCLVTAQMNKNHTTKTKKHQWYGPSYQPSWWNPNDVQNVRPQEFSYRGSNSPATWATKFEECGGAMQSPININTYNLERRRTKRPLLWNNYSNTPKTMVIENSKHSIHGTCLWGRISDTPYITNGPLQYQYYFSQFHFHWGGNSSLGSEHTIDGRRYPLEMHVVHDRGADTDDSSPSAEGEELVVVAFVFELSERDNPNLRNFLNSIKEVQGSEKKKGFVQPFPLDKLFNTFSSDYIAYKGSLTTPPCLEGVVWIIATKPLPISEKQLAIIRRSVKDKSGSFIQNFRPLQNINGRDMYFVPYQN